MLYQEIEDSVPQISTSNRTDQSLEFRHQYTIDTIQQKRA